MQRTKLAILVLLLISILSVCPAAAAKTTSNILVLNSYHMGYSWGESVLKGIRNTLEKSETPLKVHYEFMDTKRHSPSAIFPILYDLYATKYATTSFDAIIASDNNALEFLVQYRDKLFPGTPVAFCGVTRFTPELLRGKSGFTGIAEEVDIKENIQLALSLFPHTKTIVLLSGGVTTSSKNNLAYAREVIPDFADRVSFTEMTKLDPPELRKQLAALPTDTVILYLSYYRTPNGTLFSVPESTALVAHESGLPVISPWLYTLGHGVLGGKMLSGVQQGEGAADLALQMLNGVSVEDLPVIHEQQNKFIFDYRQLRKCLIAKPLLPAKAEILFEPQTIFYKYKRIIIIAIVCFFWLAITILFLLHLLREKNKTTTKLIREEERLESLLELNNREKGSSDELILFCVQKVRELLNAHSAVYLTITANLNVDRYCISNAQRTLWCTLAEPLNIGKLTTPWEQVIRKKKVARLKAGYSNRPVVWPLGMNRFENCISLPIWEQDRLRALIVLGDNEVTFSKSDERQLTLMMQGVANLIQKQRAHEKSVQLAAELRHSQKMEALGTVAGGIAHDFNNILGAISSCCELALDDVPAVNPAHEDLKQALKAAYRGKQIISQIRKFSNRAEIGTELISLPTLTEECVQLLKTLLPSTIDIRYVSHVDYGGMLLGNAGEVHQIIMNLSLNADHAMFSMQGALSIELNALDINEQSQDVPPELPSGRYLSLSVSDTGTGIAPDLLPRIFDPFFSTKKERGGTGLGLSTVHSISKKYGGTVTVRSELNRGTTFTVYLPEAVTDSCAWHPEAEITSTQGTEHILVVDDDKEILYSVRKFLAKQGYTVTALNSSKEALQYIQEAPAAFELLIADQIMPELTGLELAAAAAEHAPFLPVIIYSGFEGADTDLFLREFEQIGIAAFLAKPFRNTELGATIRNVLDSQKDHEAWL